MAIDKMQAYQYQANSYNNLETLRPLQGGAQGTEAINGQQKVSQAGFSGAYANISLIDGELHPESRDEMRGNKLYMMA